VPGLGIVMTVLFVLLIGTMATNVLGHRLVDRGEALLMRVPVFKTIYSPVKQLLLAFSPDNAYGFKRVVMVRDPSRGLVMGFLTKEFMVERPEGAEALMAVYVPTNHLYLGDVILCRRDEAFFPDLTVEEGVRMFLTGGMSLPGRIRPSADADRTRP
jgi:uncharacterized membrane protein